MVIGRRFDTQATALTKQGRLAVYPSSRGQEACQVGAVAGAASTATGSSRPTASPSRWSPAASTRSRCSPCCAATGTAATTRRRRGPRRSARRWPPRPSHAAGLAYGEARKGRGHRRAGVRRRRRAPARATSTRRSTSPPCSRRRSSSSCRTTSTRSASRCPGRPPRRRWRTRASATASPRAGRRQRPDGRARGAERGGRRTRAPGNGPFLVEAHTYRMDAAHQRRRRHAATATRPRSTAWLRARPDRPAGDLPARPAALLDDDGGRRGRRPRPRPSPPTCATRMNAERRRSTRCRLFDHVYADAHPAAARAARPGAGRAGGGGRPPIGRDTGGEPLMAGADPDHGEGAQRAPCATRWPPTTTVLVFGEDVGTLGGVFRVTDGLTARLRRGALLRHPAGRVRHRRLRGRHGHGRLAAGRRDAVRRVRLPGVRADRLARGQDAQPHPRRASACRSSSGCRTPAASAASSTTATPARPTTRTPRA